MSNQKYAYWLKSGFYSALQKFSVLLFGIGSVMILNRSLPKVDMGVWNLFLTGSAFVEVIRHSLIKNAVIKYLNSEDESTHVHINSAALSLNMIVTTLITLLLVAFIVPLSIHLKAPALAMVMYCFIPGLLLLIPFSHFEWVQNANADFKGIFWAYLVRQGVSFILIVAHLLSGHQMTLTALIIYFDLGLLAGVIVSGSFAYKFLQRRYVFEWGWVKKLWSFGGIVFGTNISATVFRNTDQLIISSSIGPAAVALYGICLRASNMVDLPSQVLADILFPKSAETMEAGNFEKVRFYYEKAVGSVLAIALPVTIGICLLPKLALLILGGKGYVEAAGILQITILYGLFLPFIKQFGTIMDSTGMPKVNFLVMTITAICNIFICSFFTYRFGLPGAAYGTFTSYAICFVITQTVMRRKIGTRFSNILRHMLQFYPDILPVLQQKISLKWKVR